jgi:hypothetical protein
VAYWFVSEQGGFTLLDSVLDDRLLDRFGHVVTVLVDGIEAGLFAARPGQRGANCRFCPFEAMCPGDRQRSWQRVKGAPELAAYVALAEGTDGSGTEGSGTDGSGTEVTG